jgi:hypothetical protein
MQLRLHADAAPQHVYSRSGRSRSWRETCIVRGSGDNTHPAAMTLVNACLCNSCPMQRVHAGAPMAGRAARATTHFSTPSRPCTASDVRAAFARTVAMPAAGAATLRCAAPQSVARAAPRPATRLRAAPRVAAASASQSPVIILPGLGNATEDYVTLSADLSRLGAVVRTAQVCSAACSALGRTLRAARCVLASTRVRVCKLRECAACVGRARLWCCWRRGGRVGGLG